MKKLFLLAVGLAMTLTACQKDEGLVSDVATTSSFTVTIPQSGVQTRAVTDAFGTGTSVNRCILEIYHGDKLYDRIEKGVSGKTVTFDNLRLVSSQPTTSSSGPTAPRAAKATLRTRSTIRRI